MTHECAGSGESEPKFRIYVDDGRNSSLIPRGSVVDTEGEARDQGEHFRSRWGPAYADREFRVVQVCRQGENGYGACGGWEAVRARRGMPS